MASFCTSCGAPLSEGQVFCTKCGARSGVLQQPSSASAAPPQSTAPLQAAPAPPAAPVAAPAAATTGGGSSFVKILLIVVGVIFVFGAIGVAGVAYVGYRIHNKAREMGLTNEHRRHSPALSTATGGSVDGCKFLSKEDVSAAIGMTVVRSEPSPGSDVGCSYSVIGDVHELTVKHAMQLNKGAMTKQDQESIKEMEKALQQGKNAVLPSAGEHPGEVPVLGFAIDENAAQFQMKLNRGLMNGLGSSLATKDVPDLGDEAFVAAGSMLFVRKNDTLVRFVFTQCPCSSDEIIPLAKKVADAL